MSSAAAPGDWIAEALPERHAWSAPPQERDLKALPGCAAVLLLVDVEGRPVQLLATQQLRRLLLSRLGPESDAQSPRTDLRPIVRGVRWRQVWSAFEGDWQYYRLARRLHPEDYRKRIAFGPAWFLRVDWNADVPEIDVAARVWQDPGLFAGPWPTERAARQTLEGLRDLFDLCRYPEQLRKTPAGQRCAYFDMGRCDAPCDGTAPPGPMIERTRAAWDFVCGGAERWLREATERMHAAAREQRYEAAALLKRQIAFATDWLRDQAEMVAPMHEHAWLLLVPATRRRAFKPFLLRDGALEDGPLVAERRLPADVAQWVSARLPAPPPETPPIVRTEQTWLSARLLARATAIVLRLARDAPPPDLEERIRTAHAAHGNKVTGDK